MTPFPTERPPRFVEGTEFTPAPSGLDGQLDGHVDDPVDGSVAHRSKLIVRGWHAWNGSPVAAVAVEAAGTRIVVTPGNEPRPDVAEAHGDPRLTQSGWKAVLDLTEEEGSDAGLRQEARAGDVTVLIAIWPSPEKPPIHLRPIRVSLTDEAVPPPLRPSPISGYVDRPHEGEVSGPQLKVAGWALGHDLAVDRVEVLIDGHSRGRARLGLPRRDVASEHTEPYALLSGFEHLLDLSDVAAGQVHALVQAWAGPSGPIVLADHRFELQSEPLPRDSISNPRRAVLAARRQRFIEGLETGLDSSAPDELNLGVVTHSLQLGGAELWLAELLRRSGAGRAFPCRVLSLSGGPLIEVFEAIGIEVQVTQSHPPSDLESYEGRLTEMAAWLGMGGHNAVLVNTVVPWFGADAAGRMEIPVVWSIHESWTPAEIWPALFAADSVPPDVRATLPAALRRANALVFVAEATRRLYERDAAAGRSVVVPYGINVELIDEYCRRTTREAARRELNLDFDARVILSVGVVQPRKAQTVLAEAFAEVSAEFPESFLAVVGDTGDEYGTALLDYLRSEGLADRTRLVPTTGDTSVWYRAADAFVSASEVESMPRTILEALTFGLPVAATSIFGVPELINDGVTGYLFEPRDKGALVQILRHVLAADESDLRTIAEAGRALAANSLDSASYAEALMALLQGLRADPQALPGELLGRLTARP